MLLKRLKRSKSTVCFHMTKLRMANIVRYEKMGKETIYWIKYPKKVKAVMDVCESMVKRTTQRIDKDL